MFISGLKKRAKYFAFINKKQISTTMRERGTLKFLNDLKWSQDLLVSRYSHLPSLPTFLLVTTWKIVKHFSDFSSWKCIILAISTNFINHLAPSVILKCPCKGLSSKWKLLLLDNLYLINQDYKYQWLWLQDTNIRKNSVKWQYPLTFPSMYI